MTGAMGSSRPCSSAATKRLARDDDMRHSLPVGGTTARHPPPPDHGMPRRRPRAQRGLPAQPASGPCAPPACPPVLCTGLCTKAAVAPAPLWTEVWATGGREKVRESRCGAPDPATRNLSRAPIGRSEGETRRAARAGARASRRTAGRPGRVSRTGSWGFAPGAASDVAAGHRDHWSQPHRRTRARPTPAPPSQWPRGSRFAGGTWVGDREEPVRPAGRRSPRGGPPPPRWRGAPPKPWQPDGWSPAGRAVTEGPSNSYFGGPSPFAENLRRPVGDPSATCW